MSETVRDPLAGLLAALAAPPATGLLVTHAGAGEGPGPARGDVLVAIDGAPVSTAEEVQKRMEASGDHRLALVAHDGRRREIEVPSGRLAVGLRPVEAGRAVAPLPPDTGPALDLDRLDAMRTGWWYAFHLVPDGEPVGYEHARLHREAGLLVLEREVAFDGGARWGIHHTVSRVRLLDTLPLRFLDFRLVEPRREVVTEGRAGASRPAHAVRAWRTTVRGPDGAHREHDVDLGPEGPPALPGYVVEAIAVTMPREDGATLHLRELIDGSGAPGLPLALVARPPAGDTRPWHYEALRPDGSRSAWAVDAEDRIVRADYGGPTTRLVGRETALDLCPAGVERQLADPR